MNILETPMGSDSFVTSYLQVKGLKHHLLLRFIKDVAAARFSREADQMLKGVAIPRLSHILISVQKGKHTMGWMTEINGAHLSAWLHCLTASDDLERALGPEGREGWTLGPLGPAGLLWGSRFSFSGSLSGRGAVGVLCLNRRSPNRVMQEDKAARIHQDRGGRGNARGPGCWTLMHVNGRG